VIIQRTYMVIII